MRITIHEFRCYRGTHTFNFEAGSLNLLSGGSGAGKSTILVAISWALHGKVTKIRPHAEPKAVPCVIIEGLGAGTIRRIAPSTLEVYLPDRTVLTADAAQGWIHRIIGRVGPWTAAATLYQEERNPLLTLPNTERFALLHSFTYGDVETEDPEFYLEKVKATLDDVKMELMILTGVYNSQYATVLQCQNAIAPHQSKWPPGSDLSQHQAMLSSLKFQIENAIRDEQSAMQTISLREACINEIGTIETELASISSIPDIVELDQKRTQLIRVHATLERLRVDHQARDRILDKLRDLGKFMFDPSRLDLLRTKKEQSDKFRELCITNNTSPERLEADQAKARDTIASYEKLREEIEEEKVIHHAWTVEMKRLKIEAKDRYEVRHLESSNRYGILREEWSSRDALLISIRNEEKAIYDKINQRIQDAHKEETRIATEAYSKLRQEWSTKCEEMRNLHMENYRVLYETAKREHDVLQTTYRNIVDANLSLQSSYENEMKERQVKIDKNRRQIEEATFSKNIYDSLCEEIHILEVKREPLVNLLPLKDLTERSQALRHLLEELLCPHCHKGVKYMNGSLDAGVTTKEERISYQKELDDIVVMIEKHKELVQINSKLDPLMERLAMTSCPIIPEAIVIPIPDSPTFSPVPDIPNWTSPSMPEITYPSEPTWITIPNPILEVPRLQRSILSETPVYTPILEEMMEKHRDEPPFRVCPSAPSFGDLFSIVSVPTFTNHEMEEMSCLEKGAIGMKLQDDLEKFKDLLPLPSSNDLEELAEIERTIEEARANITKRDNLIARLEECRRRCPDLPTYIPGTVSSLQRQANDIEERIYIGKAMIVLDGHQKAAMETYTKLTALSTRSASLASLSQIIRDTSAAALATTVDSINATVNAVVGELFEDPIEVTLLTQKELKTKDKTKSQVNLQIKYRETVYDGLSGLSGGEKDRISLALTVGIARMTGTPIVLLDECMASLDGPLREKCVKVLRRYLPLAIVIHVCHETVAGFHDATIAISR